MVKAVTALAIGSRVIVNFGMREVEGVIDDAYNGGSGQRYRVRVPLLGPQGEELGEDVSWVLPASEVRAA